MHIQFWAKSILVLLASVVYGQTAPDEALLLKRAADSLNGSVNLEFTADFSAEVGSGKPLTTFQSVVYQSSGGKYRVEFRGEAPEIHVEDGSNLWLYRFATNQYHRIVTRGPYSDFAAIMIQGGGVPLTFRGMPESVLTRADQLTIDGQVRDCWVRELRISNPGKVMTREFGEIVDSIWYDKDLGIPLKRIVAAKTRTSPTESFSPMRMTMTVHDLHLSPSLDHSLFEFVLPPGAEEISPPPSGAIGMQPAILVRQTAPRYPKDAKLAHVEGTVRLAVTIAKDGTVKELKVISGPPLLVDAAIEAVKQWVYKPTLLNGDAVEVKTTVSVNFSLNRPPSTAPQ